MSFGIDSSNEPIRHPQSAISADHQMKINKAFKQLLASRATIFDGKDCTKYKPWKEAISREVEGMQLSHGQWLDLLRARTSGGPSER